MQFGKFPLFQGATRVATVFGIPRNVFGGILAISAVTFLVAKHYGLAIGPILWVICYAITKRDERMFRILFLFLLTKFYTIRESGYVDLWNGSSVSPVSYNSFEDLK